MLEISVKNNIKNNFAIIIVLGGLLIFPSPLYAYLDPGVGSMILQGLVAAFFAAAIAIKLFWRRLLGFFITKKNKQIERDDN